MTAHVTVRIRAHMPHGVALGHPWGIALDGLLASQLWVEHLTSTPADRIAWPSETDQPPDLDLPLARCARPADVEDWHWAATCADPAPTGHRVTRWWTEHADIPALTSLIGGPPSVSSRQGRYRDRHMPVHVLVTPWLEWWAVGDPEKIHDLLSPLPAVGKYRRHGEGVISHWEVTPIDRDPHDAGHLHIDGTLGRPAPADCIPTHLHHLTGPAGIRPPYMHPSRRRPLILPV